MANECILAHDLGTSAVKTSVVSAQGVIEASETTAYSTHAEKPGWAEQDPADWWAGVCRNTRALMGRRPELRGQIAAIGLSGHMMGCVAVSADGEPLRRAMLHSDCRATAECERVRQEIGAERLYRITGNILNPRSSLCKLLWLRANEPSLYARTARFLQSKDFVVGRMTGAFESTDLSDASHAQWIDIRKKAYAEDVLGELGLDAGKLPRLCRATDVVGKLTAEAAGAMGLPSGIGVVAGGGDGSCATVGAGAVNPGDTYCCIGTTAWIASTSEEPVIDGGQRIFDVLSLDGETCGVFGTIQAAGRSLDWVLGLLGEPGFERFDEMLASVPPGSDGLIFLPYLEGERSPIWDADARGVFFGLTPAHGRAHCLRAVTEGVSFALRSVLDVMREGGSIPALRLIGGGAQSDAWQQMLADVCDVEIQLLSTRSADATSLGAAIAAGVGVGLFSSLADGARTISITHSRPPDRERSGRYERFYRLYLSLYPRLKPAFAELWECLAGPTQGD